MATSFASGITVRSPPSVDSVVSSFVTNWPQDKDFYLKAARLAHELCEDLLARNAIRAIVTYRAKQGSRLEIKLQERARIPGKTYQNFDDIRHDIVDLAGVRIALYYPKDAQKLVKIIGDAFVVVRQISFPEHRYVGELKETDTKAGLRKPSPSNSMPDPEQRFAGYLADHYRVKMKVENFLTQELQDDLKRPDPMIEIQVASVLMHAWAEVDHNLAYKSLTSGPASQAELRILDAINGLVHTGEVLLRHLQSAVDDRVLYQNKNFSDQYELLSFLRTRYEAQISTDHLDALLHVLKMMKLDSPLNLDSVLKGHNLKLDLNSPVALMLLELILGDLTEMKNKGSDLGFKMKPVVTDDIELIANSEDAACWIDYAGSRRLDSQCDLLLRAIRLADYLRYPKIEMEKTNGILGRFDSLFSDITLLKFELLPDKRDKNDRWKTSKVRIDSADDLWMWFEKSDDILFRIALKLARLNSGDIVSAICPARYQPRRRDGRVTT